jgi:hypothetical protein
VINEDYATERSAREAAAAAAFQPPVPPRTRERRRVKETATLAVLVLAVFGFASYEFVASAGHAQRATAAAQPRRPVSAVSAATPGVQVSPATAVTAPASTIPASTIPASTGPASPAPASTPPPQVLTVASLTAFGPAGPADGDNPQFAGRALVGDPATPWYSDWYASPGLGDAPGTGLLLDMGRTVTVTSVRVSLDGSPGARLQLRAGSQPTLGFLPQVASISDAGNTVELRPSTPVHVRYVLIWFTQLPPDPAGTYQASVYQVIVRGQP